MLRRGSTGEDVRALQSALADALINPGPRDGIFGPLTDAALRRFQAREGLVINGIAGPLTLAALGLAPAPPTQPTGDPFALPTPPPGWLMGVDISDAQGIVDAPALARAGVAFAWVKLTDGERSGQRHGADNARALQEAGIPCGFYGVLEPYGRARVETQVLNFTRALADLDFLPRLPPWCDFELARGESGLEALETAAEWCELAEVATGWRPMIYTGPAFIATLARFAGSAADSVLARLARFPLAVAHYGRTIERGPTVPRPWKDWTVWQYSGDPAPPGQPARAWHHLPGRPRAAVDVDFFRGTIDDLIALGNVG